MIRYIFFILVIVTACIAQAVENDTISIAQGVLILKKPYQIGKFPVRNLDQCLANVAELKLETDERCFCHSNMNMPFVTSENTILEKNANLALYKFVYKNFATCTSDAGYRAISLGYDIKPNNSKYFSFKLQFNDDYKAASHINTLHLDKQTGAVVLNKDIFNYKDLAVFKDEIYRALLINPEYSKYTENIDVWYANAILVEEIDNKHIQFYFKDNQVVFILNPRAITAQINTMLEVDIPLEKYKIR